MKNYSKLSIACALTALFASSCIQPENPDVVVEPVFPEEVDIRTVKAGESVELSLAANLDWTLSIEGEGAGNFFWIDDDGLKESSISGEAGEIKATIVFSETEELDNNRVCTVNLTMAEQTKKVAEYTRLALERTFEIYVGQAGEYDFARENGAYVYEKAESAELISFAGSVRYSIPVKVISNYAWNLSLPEWLSAGEVNSGEAGATEFILSAILSSENENGAKDNVKFLDSVNTSVEESLEIKLPAFVDRLEIETATSFIFNAAGEQQMPTGGFSEVPGIAYVIGVEGFVVKALEFNGERHETSYADWVESEIKFNSGDSYLKNATVEITPKANDGDARVADILILPKNLSETLVEELCDPNSCEFLEKYQPYVLCRLEQEAAPKTDPVGGDYITLSDNEDDTYKAELVKLEKGWMHSMFYCEEAYTLTYTDEYSQATLIFSEAFDHYEFCNVWGSPVPEDGFWLELNPFSNNSKSTLYMNPQLYKPLEGEEPESFVVFYDAEGNGKAVIQCLYREGQEIGGGEGGDDTDNGILSILSGKGNIKQLSESDDIYQGVKSITGASDIYAVTVSSFGTVLKSETSYWNVQLLGLDGNELNDGSFYLEHFNEQQFTVYVGESVQEVTSCVITLWGESAAPFAAIYFTWDPEAKDENATNTPFSFLTPEYVTGAQLQKGASEEVLSMLKGEWGSLLNTEKVYTLTYTSVFPQNATLKCPSYNPGPAYGNGEESYDYWLQGEYEDGTLWVSMSEVGLVDYFWFHDAQWTENYFLVCTRTQ